MGRIHEVTRRVWQPRQAIPCPGVGRDCPCGRGAFLPYAGPEVTSLMVRRGGVLILAALFAARIPGDAAFALRSSSATAAMLADDGALLAVIATLGAVATCAIHLIPTVVFGAFATALERRLFPRGPLSRRRLRVGPLWCALLAVALPLALALVAPGASPTWLYALLPPLVAAITAVLYRAGTAAEPRGFLAAIALISCLALLTAVDVPSLLCVREATR